jgi:hypothetical protein
MISFEEVFCVMPIKLKSAQWMVLSSLTTTQGQIFGYEYVRQQEIMHRIFGSELNSDVVFFVGSKMLTTILNYVVENIK